MIITSNFTYKASILNFARKNPLYYINRFCTRKVEKIKERYPYIQSIAVICHIVFRRTSSAINEKKILMIYEVSK